MFLHPATILLIHTASILIVIKIAPSFSNPDNAYRVSIYRGLGVVMGVGIGFAPIGNPL
jgi:hypothetical protein